MTLSISRASTGGSSEGYMGDGIYIDKAQILKVEEVTEEENIKGAEKFNNFKPKEVAIRTTVRILKNDWEKIITISGNYKRQTTKPFELIDWGGAFKINILLGACGLPDDVAKKIQASNGIPPKEVLDECVGKMISILTYTKETGGYATWNTVASDDRDPAGFKDYFLSQVKKGYPRNYKQPNSSPQPQSNSVQEAISSISTESL